MKKTITITILFLLLINLTSAIVTPVNPAPTTSTTGGATLDTIQNTIIQEHIRTRTEFTGYTDRKIQEMINTVRTDGQKMVDENFKVLDQRIQEIATKLVIKITIGIIIAIILGLSIWYAIYHRINKLLSRRPTDLTRDEYQLTRAGLITPEYAEKIAKEHKTTYKMPPSPEYRETQPRPPSIEQIEAMIQLKRKEKEMEDLQKIKNDKINKYHAEAKKVMPQIQKLQDKNEKGGGLLNPEFSKKRRQKKIEKLQKQLEPHKIQVEKALQIEKTLDQKIAELKIKSEEFSKVIMPNEQENKNKETKKVFNIPETILEMPEFQTREKKPTIKPYDYEKEILPPIAPKRKEEFLPPEPPTFKKYNITKEDYEKLKKEYEEEN